MNTRLRASTEFILAIGWGLILGALMPHLQASGTGPSLGIRCQVVDGIPTTVSQTKKGRTVSIIKWESDAFLSSGYSPERRCQEVSRRFEAYRMSGQLRYLTTGRMNGQNVICVADRDGGPCVGSLYTLKPGQNPNETLSSLLNVRRGASGALSESPGRIWVRFSDLLSRRPGSSLEVQPASKGASPKVIRSVPVRSESDSELPF